MFLSTLLVICGIWVAFEVALDIFRRAEKDAVKKDAGSLRLLTVVIYVSVGAGAFLAGSRFGRLALPPEVRWGGIAVIAAGLLFRVWAVVTLRRFFTVDVAIHRDHELVQKGPYRFLRHPSYSGSLLSFLGLAICFSNWISAIVILVPISAVFWNRMRVEEAALRSAFPETYESYAVGRWRLVPGVF